MRLGNTYPGAELYENSLPPSKVLSTASRTQMGLFRSKRIAIRNARGVGGIGMCVVQG